jgi:hypothetical protein
MFAYNGLARPLPPESGHCFGILEAMKKLALRDIPIEGRCTLCPETLRNRYSGSPSLRIRAA